MASAQSDSSYKVVVRGQEFALSHAQISFDAPNYFTDCFLSGFAESVSRTLTLDRNPALFALIVEHLSGYTVLPLAPSALPATMSAPVALQNLRADADFFGLRALCEAIDSERRVELRWMGYSSEVVDVEDVREGRLPEGVEWRSGGLISARSELPVLVRARGAILR